MKLLNYVGFEVTRSIKIKPTRLLLVYAGLSGVVAVAALFFIDRKLFNKLDFQEEIKQGNIAAAIFIFVAIVMSFALK